MSCQVEVGEEGERERVKASDEGGGAAEKRGWGERDKGTGRSGRNESGKRQQESDEPTEHDGARTSEEGGVVDELQHKEGVRVTRDIALG